jgi:hypothetical protein
MKSSKDYERSVLVSTTVMFKSLHGWMTVSNSPCFSSFMEFLDLYSSFSP